MNELVSFVRTIEIAIWGVPLLCLFIGVSIYLTCVLRGVQFRYLFKALSLIGAKEKKSAQGDISPFQSLMTSMASAVGTGSIVGIATGISAGGVGAIFWLWVTSFLLMAVKYAEALLAVRYRTVDKNGEMSGGPMYYIAQGLGWKKMAALFAVFASIATFGTGNLVQINSIAEAVHNITSIPTWLTGLVFMGFTVIVLMGGIKSIGRISALLVPIMGFFYIACGIYVITAYWEYIPQAFRIIVSSAFTGQAACGGFIGSTAMMAVQMGVSRSTFCSEAGLGISSIAAAAARTESSGRQAMLSMTATLLATVLICTITGLVIVITGVLGQTDSNGALINGASLAIAAFESVIPGGKFIVATGLVLFAYSTLIAWAYYGEKCCEFLFGEKSIKFYRVIYSLAIIPGAVFSLEIVWSFANITNALMSIPNMIALLALSGVIQKETIDFLAQEKGQKYELEEELPEALTANV